MVARISDKAAIVGIGTTEFSKDSGRSELALASEAVKKALDDAGLTPADVDGMVTFTIDQNEEVDVARAIGCRDLGFYSRIPYGGGAATGTLLQAAMAVATGVAEVVVCYRALNGRSGQRYSAGVSGNHRQRHTLRLVHALRPADAGVLGGDVHAALHAPHRLHARRTVRSRACDARIRRDQPCRVLPPRPFTREEYDGARSICEPLRLFDSARRATAAAP